MEKQNTKQTPQDSAAAQQAGTQEASATAATPAAASAKPLPAKEPVKAMKSNPYPDDWQDKVIVEQWEVAQLNGGLVEVPNTRMVQTYEPMFFERMLKENFFSESSWKYEIKHDPRQK
jgi:hypothetical protein